MAFVSSTYSTLFMLVGGSEPLDADMILAQVGPTLRPYYTAPSGPEVNYLSPSWKADTDPDGNVLGYHVEGGPLSGWPSQSLHAYVTGVLWHLRNKNPGAAADADRATVRSQLRAGPYAALVETGFVMMQTGFQAAGATLPGYQGWPVMPPLPVPEPSTPAPRKLGALPWFLAIGAALAAARKFRWF